MQGCVFNFNRLKLKFAPYPFHVMQSGGTTTVCYYLLVSTEWDRDQPEVRDRAEKGMARNPDEHPNSVDWKLSSRHTLFMLFQVVQCLPL